jgi:hypothetical protein
MDSTKSNSQPSSEDSHAREKLIALRTALLHVHKTLLDMERREYERENGPVNTGELFRLVLDHAQFDWLHNISEFVVRIDETLAAKEPVAPEYMTAAISVGRCLCLQNQGTGFRKNILMRFKGTRRW